MRQRNMSCPAYLRWIYDETATKVGTVTLVSHTDRDQQNTFVRDIVGGRLGSGTDVVATLRRLGLNDGRVTELCRAPINLGSDKSEHRTAAPL